MCFWAMITSSLQQAKRIKNQCTTTPRASHVLAIDYELMIDAAMNTTPSLADNPHARVLTTTMSAGMKGRRYVICQAPG